MQAGAVFSLFLPNSSISMGPSIIVDIFSYDNSYRKREGRGSKMLIIIITFLRPEHDLDDQT